ncbi:hypothetical protein EKO27_g3581 [Xylaria grammica]|uniref:Uncharacterized protein n=1 Tax=Xylaria grammica TaxID=363999 RepID=A0A439DAU6_9PEZI|nr:hypothetical protein EKO27_g3581 [Xylaria grammica]
MLRQLGVGCRNPAHSLASRLFRSPRPQSRLSWQRHFFSQSRIPRQAPRSGPQTNYHRQNGNGARQLHAGIYASVCVSIGFLVLNDTLDFKVRRRIGIEVVQSVTGQKDVKERWIKFYETGHWLLTAYCGGHVEYHEDAIRAPDDCGLVNVTIFSSRDPDVEGGTVVLCLVALRNQEGDTYFPTNGNRLTDVTESLIPKVEAFASGLEASPKVRGAMVLLEEDGDWKSLYWDGMRWINVVYLEWQTAESMGFLSDDDFKD